MAWLCVSSYHNSLVYDKFGVFELVRVVGVCCYSSLAGSVGHREISGVVSWDWCCPGGVAGVVLWSRASWEIYKGVVVRGSMYLTQLVVHGGNDALGCRVGWREELSRGGVSRGLLVILPGFVL